ncbi:hypothetical protein N2152v2_006409 [Parachlorella kessleri]
MEHKTRTVTGINAVSAASHSVERSSNSSCSEDAPLCWICLDQSGPLVHPCKCPRKETHCEFCDSRLPDWKGTLTPQCGANAPAVMNVNFDGRTYSFEVKPGPEGYRQFTEAIRRAFNLPDDSELNITFTCDEPTAGAPEEQPPPTWAPASNAGSLLTLQGAGAYDAAVHCASVSAARRMSTPTPTPRTMSASSDVFNGPLTPEPSAPAPASYQLPNVSPAGSSSFAGSPPQQQQLSQQQRPAGGSGSLSGDMAAASRKRFGNGLGRKIRTALADFLSSNSSSR